MAMMKPKAQPTGTPTVLRMRVSSTRPAFGIGAAPMDMSVEMSAVVNKSAGLGLVHVPCARATKKTLHGKPIAEPSMLMVAPSGKTKRAIAG